MRKKFLTKHGHELLDASSAMQKAIRRGDARIAGYFALDLHEYFHTYVWKRLMTISAEDCWGSLTQEVNALHSSYTLINTGVRRGEKRKGRIFISKAVILLCAAKKSRDPDHLQCFVYDKMMFESQEIEQAIIDGNDVRHEIPDYAFDCHTLKGKAMGKTKDEFVQTEQRDLYGRQAGLFDEVINLESLDKK